MGPVDEALEKIFLPKLLGLDSISGRLRKLIYLENKRAGLVIRKQTEVVDKSHQTSLVCSKLLAESLITGEALSTSEHRACVRRYFLTFNYWNVRFGIISNFFSKIDPYGCKFTC